MYTSKISPTTYECALCASQHSNDRITGPNLKRKRISNAERIGIRDQGARTRVTTRKLRLLVGVVGQVYKKNIYSQLHHNVQTWGATPCHRAQLTSIGERRLDRVSRVWWTLQCHPSPRGPKLLVSFDTRVSTTNHHEEILDTWHRTREASGIPYSFLCTRSESPRGPTRSTTRQAAATYGELLRWGVVST